MPERPGLPRQCDHPAYACPGAVCAHNFGLREFRVTCLACPLQISGHVDGVRFYFRARHDRWRIETPDEGPSLIIAQGNTDDFTVGQAVDLIEQRMSAWVWSPPVQGEVIEHARQLS